MDLAKVLPSRKILLITALLSLSAGISLFVFKFSDKAFIALLFLCYSFSMVAAAGFRQKIKSDYIRNVFYAYLIFIALLLAASLFTIVEVINSREYNDLHLIVLWTTIFLPNIILNIDSSVWQFCLWIISWSAFFMFIGYVFFLMSKSGSKFVRGKGRAILAIAVFIILAIISYKMFHQLMIEIVGALMSNM